MRRSLASALTVFSLLCCGCHQQRIVVDNEYISARSLASFWVRTPDPSLCHPSSGQRLIVSWLVPRAYLALEDLHIEMSVRFGDDEEVEVFVPIRRKRGQYIFEALDDDYWDHCGIRTYRAQVIGDGCVLDEWKHQLWAEWIEFDNYQGEVDWWDNQANLDHAELLDSESSRFIQS